MEIKTSRQSFDHLFTARPIDVQARAVFEARAGWRYGLAFGAALLLVAWGVDAVELAYARAALFFDKIILALILVVPLCIAAGGLAGRAHGFFGRKLLAWMLVGAVIGFIAIHIPFEGASLVAGLVDAAARGLTLVPFTPGAQERVVTLVVFGAIVGLLAGVLQILATTWAWDRSTADNRMTMGGWLALLVSLPLAIALGAVFDGAANAQLRGPLYTTHRVIQLALNTPPDMNVQGLDVFTMLDYFATQRWRAQFTPQYTQSVADFDPDTLRWSYIDTEFANGFLWRCNVTRNGEILQSCADLAETYSDYMSQFLAQGTVRCENCDVRIAQSASDWRSGQGAAGTPNSITLTHRAAGLVLVNARLANGGQVECRFMGASPVIIRDCTSK